MPAPASPKQAPPPERPKLPYTASTKPNHGDRECPNCHLMHADPNRELCHNRACKTKLPPPQHKATEQPGGAPSQTPNATPADKKNPHLDGVFGSLGRPKKSLGNAVADWPELPTQEACRKKAEEKKANPTPTPQAFLLQVSELNMGFRSPLDTL